MRVEEFSIRRYGPLPDTGRVQLGSFSLLFGKNEYGKTLTIDALVKLLLQRGRTIFERIARVDEEPEGYVILEYPTGKTMKLPEKGDLKSLTGLSPEESRNIFIIRNSDLSIATEAEFYRNVTDRLTGLRTEEILSIRNQLQDIGKLTRPDSTGSLRDWAGEKLKTRTKTAERLVGRLEELSTRVVEEELDRLEEVLLKVREQASETDRRIRSFEEARKREKYEKGNAAYQAAISANQELEKLNVYVNEETDLWAGCEKDIASWTTELEGLEQEVSTKKLEYAQQVGELDEKALVFQSLSDRKKRIDDEIRPEVKTYEIKSGEFKAKEVKRGFFNVATIISATLLTFSAVGTIINPSPLFYVLLVLSLTSTVVFATLRFSLTREKGWLSGIFERIRLAVSRFGIHGQTIEEILLGIQGFDEEYSQKQRELELIRTQVSVLENEIKRITENDIAGLNKRIAEARNKIDGIAQKTGLRKLEDYLKILQLKTGHAQSVDTQVGILKSHFGSIGEQLEENLPFWLSEIQALKEFENKAEYITYDEKSVSQLRVEFEKLQSEEQQLEQKMTNLYEELQEIEREVNEILQPEDDYLHCDSSADMLAIRDRLLHFITHVDKDKENALTAISIFENLQKEEEEKISSLFGRDSPISKYFSEITGRLYEEVEFVIDDIRKVRVKLKNGVTLDANQLSGGAYDQLYLSIRLALGEKLLKGIQGFFIMDDPFIKADRERLERQLDILKKICGVGWQIIYFTAKDEVVELLKADIEEGKVSYIELQDIFAQM
jgi:exonuclease SbcC